MVAQAGQESQEAAGEQRQKSLNISFQKRWVQVFEELETVTTRIHLSPTRRCKGAQLGKE